MAPVCSPQVAKGLASISDLSNHIVLQDNLETPTSQSNWEFWAKENNLKLPHFQRARKYGQANLVIQAAINGLGVAMGRSPLVVDAIRDGTLVYPFGEVAQSQFSYWLVCQHAALQSNSVQAFRSWIQEEAANSAK